MVNGDFVKLGHRLVTDKLLLRIYPYQGPFAVQGMLNEIQENHLQVFVLTIST
jgi:hypothetical protein